MSDKQLTLNEIFAAELRAAADLAEKGELVALGIVAVTSTPQLLTFAASAREGSLALPEGLKQLREAFLKAQEEQKKNILTH